MDRTLKAIILIILGIILGLIIFNMIVFIRSKLKIEFPLLYMVIVLSITYLLIGFVIGFILAHIMKTKGRNETIKFNGIYGLLMVVALAFNSLIPSYLNMSTSDADHMFAFLMFPTFYFMMAIMFSPVLLTSILGGLINYYIRKKTDFLRAKLKV
jgi:hypothetical protein